MQTHNIHAAKTHFSQLVDAAAGGETIIIAKAGIPVAKLVPIAAPKRRGMLAGATFNAEVSDALDADMADLFEGKA
jgi:prevent-host-death family protein